MSSNDTFVCEWCNKEVPKVPNKNISWYGFKFCRNKCATAWGKSGRRPRSPKREDYTLRRFDCGGATAY